MSTISQGNGGKERARWGVFPFGRKEENRPLVDVAYDSALAAYRAWHGLEGRKRDIIDFDLTEGPSESDRKREEWTHSLPTAEERRRIIAGLEMVKNEIESVTPPQNKDDQHNHEFGKAQVRASSIFAMLRAGQDFDYNTLIENTLCVAPLEIPSQVLEYQQGIVDNRHQDWVQSGDPAPQDLSYEGMLNWKAENLKGQEETVSEFKEAADKALSEISKFLGYEIRPDLEIYAVNVPEYYWAWSDRQNGIYRIRLNFSRSRNKFWTQGKIEELASHEAQAHIGRMTRREKLLRDGKLHPFFGLTTVHGPEAVVDEGLGVTMVKFIPDAYNSLSPEGKFQVESTILRHLVLGALQVKLNSDDPPSIDEAIAFVKKYIPWDNIEEIEQQAREISQDPKYKIYRLAYAIGTWTHLVYARSLNREGKRVFLEKLFSLPYTPKQEAELWESLVQQERYRHRRAYQILDFLP